MKNFNCSLMAALLAGTFVLSSCSSDELPVGNEVQQLATESAMTFSFSAPAVMGDEADTRVFNIGESSIDSRFDKDDRVYVYIKSGNSLIYANEFLRPSDISADGKKCTLAIDGLLFIYKTISGVPRLYAPQEGDVISFYYGMTLASTDEEPYYSFATDGSKLEEMYKDYCLAEMVVKSIDDNGNIALAQKDDDTKRYFTFKNINSIFRQKLIFKNSSGAVVNPTIKEITISISGGDEFAQDYYPFSSKAYGTAPIRTLGPDKDGNIYFSVRFNELNKEGIVQFFAIDTNDNTYYGIKGSARGGFENNKYYNGDFTLKQANFKLPKINVPFVRWLDMNTSQYEDVPSIGYFNSQGDTNFDITMSGSSEHLKFVTYGSGTFTLDNIDAYFPKYDGFLEFYGPDATVILNLKGDNLIKSESYVSRLYSRSNRNVNLKLKCDGSQATITFMSKKTFLIDGFEGFSNNPDFGSGQLNYDEALSADQLEGIAAEGYTVERTAVKQSSTNPGYYEVTFTVKKK